MQQNLQKPQRIKGLYREIICVITVWSFLFDCGAYANMLRPFAFEERRSDDHVVSGVLFGIAPTPEEKMRLDKIRIELNDEFGIWQNEIAMNLTKQIFDELVNIFDKLCRKAIIKREDGVGKTTMDNLARVTLFNDGIFDLFKLAFENWIYHDGKNYITIDWPFDEKIRIFLKDKTQIPVDALKDIGSLRLKYYRVIQWDFVNRFPGAQGMILWRGVNGDWDSVFDDSAPGDIVEAHPQFFSFMPEEAMIYADISYQGEYIVICFVPVSSMRHTSWLDPGITNESEIVADGPIRLIDVMFGSDPHDAKRLIAAKTQYERALLDTNILSEDVRLELMKGLTSAEAPKPVNLSPQEKTQDTILMQI